MRIIITIVIPTHTPAEKISPIAWHEFKTIDKRRIKMENLITDIGLHLLCLLNKDDCI
jgi:hypothetical protein